MKGIKLYKIRNWVRGLMPLYISICAALLLELKTNINYDIASILYIGGIISFGVACVISNKLSIRCNDYGRIYDIKIDSYDKNSAIKIPPSLEEIYEKRENKINTKMRFLQYHGVFLWGFIGLILIVMSYNCFKNQSYDIDNQNIRLRTQIDSLKTINDKQTLQISELEYINDFILKQSEQKSIENVRSNKIIE